MESEMKQTVETKNYNYGGEITALYCRLSRDDDLVETATVSCTKRKF